MTNDLFKLKAQGASVRGEALAALTTFATMAYIIFVQPVVLSAAGMDAGAVFTSTCLITAFSTLLMALLANYPVAVAPAMGHNFFFAFVVVLTMKVQWPVALAAIVGLPLGVVGRPEAIISLPPSLAPTALKLDLVGALKQGLFAIIFIFFFLDLFDTVGSLIGIAKQAGLMQDGKLPRVGRALL